MKNKIFILGFILGILFGAIAFYATSSFICGFLVLMVVASYFCLFLNKIYYKYLSKVSRFHECYIFINNFIISLSIKASIIGAFESVTSTISEDLKNELSQIKDMREIEKINYLISYFKFDDYRLFCDVINLWMEEGGNILAMSNYVTNHIREIEEYINFCESKSKSKFFEFVLLWGFTILIVLVLRIVLNDFLSQMLNNIVFKIGVVMVFSFMMISLHLFMMKMTSLEIGGWQDGKK